MYKVKTVTMYSTSLTVILRENADGTIISFGEYPANTDYQAYLKWLEEGNEPLPAEE